MTAMTAPIGDRPPRPKAETGPGWTALAPLAIAVLAPFALGSDRPLAWLVWAGLAGGALAVRALYAQGWGRKDVRSDDALIPVAFALGALALMWAIIQIGPSAISLDPRAGQLAVLRGLSYGVVFGLALDMARTRAARRHAIATVIVAGAVLHGVVALALLTQWGDSGLGWAKSAYHGVATGGFVNRNALAANLGMGLLVGLALLWHRTAGRWHAPLLLLTLVAIGLALLATGSRMGIVSCLTGAGAMAVIRRRGPAPTPRRPGWLIAALAGGLGLAAILVQILPRMASVGADWTIRFQLYRQVAGLIAQRPLTGHGLDAFALAFQQVQAPPLPAEVVWRHSHSAYLSLWAELGLLFGSLPLIALVLIGWRLWQQRAAGDPLGLAAFGVLVQAALHSTLDFSFQIAGNTFLFLVILALGLMPPASPARPARHPLRPEQEPS